MTPETRVRIVDEYEGPWHELRGKIGIVIDRPGFEQLIPVQFTAGDLWFSTTPDEDGVFYFTQKDMKEAP
jgi:hypothetical protein